MRMKRKCELCSNVAAIYCGSDQASLCCQCDSKVHGANILVAKHSRNLLCHVCQSQTPWTASGPKLGPAFSVCQTCLSANNRRQERELRHREMMNNDGDHHQNHDGLLADDGGDDDGGDEDDNPDDSDNLDDDEDEEDDGDNQVVPWSYSVSHLR